jgi:hypothetical protein
VNLYGVTSPTWTYVEPVTDDGQGPAYDECEFLYVSARTANEAKWKACRHWRRAGVAHQWECDFSHPLSEYCASQLEVIE